MCQQKETMEHQKQQANIKDTTLKVRKKDCIALLACKSYTQIISMWRQGEAMQTS